jgi:hypothetical protein
MIATYGWCPKCRGVLVGAGSLKGRQFIVCRNCGKLYTGRDDKGSYSIKPVSLPMLIVFVWPSYTYKWLARQKARI